MMSSVEGIGPPRLPIARRENPRGGFSVGADAAHAPASPQATEAASPAAVGSLLALQEQAGDERENRQSRRRAQELLQLLAALQRALLQGRDDADSLRNLAALVERLPTAPDPALQSIMQSIALRARVELARRRHNA